MILGKKLKTFAWYALAAPVAALVFACLFGLVFHGLNQQLEHQEYEDAMHRYEFALSNGERQ